MYINHFITFVVIKRIKMKKINFVFTIVCALAFCLQSCNNGKTYAEMKEEEADAINAWISRNNINVISEKNFYAQDTMTTENQYVLFEESGVYMNIIQKGPKYTEGEHAGEYKGKVLGDGSQEILSRFVEVAMQERSDLGMAVGDTLLANMGVLNPDYYIYDEEFKVTIDGTSYSATFQGRSLMYNQYGSTAVPTGWLIPLKYVKPFRTTSSEQVTRVRLIVPHGQGSSTASKYVYPCFYELTYNLGK